MKALELDYWWDMSKYPTPAWGIHIVDIYYNKTMFNIPKDTWKRELRLWACDCAERTLPIWEDHARMHAFEYVSLPKNVLNDAREHAHNRMTQAQVAHKYTALIKARCIVCNHFCPYSDVLDAVYSTIYLGHTAHYTACRAVDAVANENRQNEKKWQREALAKRIDNVAPWRIE